MNPLKWTIAASVLALPLVLPESGSLPGDPVLAKLEREPAPAALSDTTGAASSSLATALISRVAMLDKPVDSELQCLAEAVYFEARSEPLEGQLAVAQVVLNRVLDPRYPDTVCDVVYQNQHRRHACQFSFACDGQPERAAHTGSWRTALLVSATAREHGWEDLTNNATHYHAEYVEPYWKDRLEYRTRFGQHIFYREALGDDGDLELVLAKQDQ